MTDIFPGQYIAWHNEHGAIRGARVREADAVCCWTTYGGAVLVEDVFAVADTLADLHELIDKHDPNCPKCIDTTDWWKRLNGTVRDCGMRLATGERCQLYEGHTATVHGVWDVTGRHPLWGETRRFRQVAVRNANPQLTEVSPVFIGDKLYRAAECGALLVTGNPCTRVLGHPGPHGTWTRTEVIPDGFHDELVVVRAQGQDDEFDFEGWSPDARI